MLSLERLSRKCSTDTARVGLRVGKICNVQPMEECENCKSTKLIFFFYEYTPRNLRINRKKARFGLCHPDGR